MPKTAPPHASAAPSPATPTVLRSPQLHQALGRRKGRPPRRRTISSNVEDDATRKPTTRPAPTYDRKRHLRRTGKRPPSALSPLRQASQPSAAKPSFGSKPRFGGDRPAFKSNRPSFRRTEDSGDIPSSRAASSPRAPTDDQPPATPRDRPRKTFSKPGTFGRKREGFAGKPSFQPRQQRQPARRAASSHRAPTRLRRQPPPRRTFGDGQRKPSFGGRAQARQLLRSRPQRSFAPRSQPRRPQAASRDSDRPQRRPRRPPERPAVPQIRRPAKHPRPFRAKDRLRPPSPRQQLSASRSSYSKAGSKPSAQRSPSANPSSQAGYAGKSGCTLREKIRQLRRQKALRKSAPRGTGKPASTFDKFKGNKKPFGKRPPARKFKPEEDE